MAKILLRDKALRVQFDDTYPNKFNETSYFNTTISDDGVSIIIANDQDPNFVDVVIAYADISFPVTGSITELVDLIRTVILQKNGLLTVYNESTDVVTNTLGLQNVGGDLYWNGTLLSGGGGGTIAGADNGLSVSGSDVIIGGTLVQNTDIETQDFRFKIEGTDPGFGFNQGLSINANINQAQLFSTTQNSLIGWDSGLNKLMIQSGSLENVTITNDGTNNVVLDPNGYNVTHNASIYHTFNDGAGLASQFAIDNAELAMSYTNFSTGSSATQSIGQGSWNAGYQLSNTSTAILDDNRAQLQFQNGATAELSKVLLETNQFTIDNTDGINVASIIGDAASGRVRVSVVDTTTNDESWVRTLLTGVDIMSSVNGGNSSTLSVNPDIIFAEGGMGFGFTALSGLMPSSLPPKKTYYFIDTNTTPGTFTFTIPVENCYAGYVMTVKDSYGNANNRIINIDTATGQMELGLTQTINTAFGYRTFVYDGSTWLTVAQG